MHKVSDIVKDAENGVKNVLVKGSKYSQEVEAIKEEEKDEESEKEARSRFFESDKNYNKEVFESQKNSMLGFDVQSELKTPKLSSI